VVVTNLPFCVCGLDASAKVLRLLKLPPVLTLLYVIKKGVLESKFCLQMLIARVPIPIILPAMSMQTFHRVRWRPHDLAVLGLSALIGETKASKNLESECDFFLVFKPPFRIILVIFGFERHPHYIRPNSRYLNQGRNILFCNHSNFFHYVSSHDGCVVYLQGWICANPKKA
jgi:hypothetical protein